MILASLYISGRHRLLLLKSTGEIWPIATNDVMFRMPSSLINPALAEACWSPELVDLWAQGDEASGSEVSAAMAPMQEARRKTAMILRKISRETERMCGKMLGDIGRSKIGGLEGLWERIAPEDETATGSITAVEAAENILNAAREEGADPIVVKPHTLPAYAAHMILMNRPDLFLADDINMADSGVFYVKSREDRAILAQVSRIIDGQSVEDQAVFSRFIEKARKVVQVSQKAREENTGNVEEYKEVEHDIPDWTKEEKSIIMVMLSRLYAMRQLQIQEAEAFAVTVMKLLKTYTGQQMDVGLIQQCLIDMGVVPPWDTLKESTARQDAQRGFTISQQKGEKTIDDLLKGNELDELRHDFTSQKVFVIDDASASELDDGISVERIHDSEDIWVHVHIADPTRFISPNSTIAAKASFQGTSLYLPERQVPLFPVEVIMKELSLGANVSTNDGAQGTMTFSSRLSPRGEVVDSTVRMGWIKQPTLVTYDAVNKALGVEGYSTTRPLGTPSILAQKPKAESVVSPEDLDDLRTLQHFATAHRRHRLKNAGLDYSRNQANVNVLTTRPDWSGNVFKMSGIPDRPRIFAGQPITDYSVSNVATTFKELSSTMMVAEMMIMSGRTAARFCGQRNLPVPYRVSAAPSLVALPGQPAITLEELLAKRNPDSLMVDNSLLSASNALFLAGSVSLIPGEHWSMGFTDKTGYVRSTSPLRRFDDMIIHWQIKSALAKERGLSSPHAKELTQEEVQTLVNRCDPASRKARRAGITANEWWQAGVLQASMNNQRKEGYEFGQDTVDLTKPLTALVTGSTIYASASINTTPVHIPALGLNARIPQRKKMDWTTGQEIQVVLSQARQFPSPIVDVYEVD